MTFTEPAAAAALSATDVVARQVRGDLVRLRVTRRELARRPGDPAVRPVSAAIDPGAEALYAAAMPRGATPWERHSHAFQGIYLERARVVLAAALDIGYLADQFAAHERDVTRPNEIACTCDLVFDPHSELSVHQASALRSWALGDAS